MKHLILGLALIAPCSLAMAADDTTAAPAAMPITQAPSNVDVYIISPKDGASVGPDVTVQFGLKGMGVAPAGMDKAGTGHFHLLIDVDQLPPRGLPIPKDDQHIHYGGGQIETTVKLKPGTHTLQLELGDANHVPFEPALVSKKITIHVK